MISKGLPQQSIFHHALMPESAYTSTVWFEVLITRFKNRFYQQMQINKLELWVDFIPEHIYLHNQFLC